MYHGLYLPSDWKEGQRYPVIVEYAGNKWRTSPGTVEGSNLGYGISGGTGVIWVCMPFVDAENSRNAVSWWGDVGATVAYCKTTVKQTCDEFGGDPESVFIAGKQSGALCRGQSGTIGDAVPDDLSLRVHARRGPSRDFCLEFC